MNKDVRTSALSVHDAVSFVHLFGSPLERYPCKPQRLGLRYAFCAPLTIYSPPRRLRACMFALTLHFLHDRINHPRSGGLLLERARLVVRASAPRSLLRFSIFSILRIERRRFAPSLRLPLSRFAHCCTCITHFCVASGTVPSFLRLFLFMPRDLFITTYFSNKHHFFAFHSFLGMFLPHCNRTLGTYTAGCPTGRFPHLLNSFLFSLPTSIFSRFSPASTPPFLACSHSTVFVYGT